MFGITNEVVEEKNIQPEARFLFQFCINRNVNFNNRKVYAMSIIFKNKGLIDLDFIRSFGVSVKEGDSPIGYFGTGLKYAISILLREKQKVSLFLGDKEYKFTTTTKVKRGKSFDFVTMNDEVLGYTTELGKNWKLWQAFRELYSNCADEGGNTFKAKAKKYIEDGHTILSVAGQDIEDIFINIGLTILQTDPIFAHEDASIHERKHGIIYYKKVRVARENDAMFDYNINGHLDLTEDRTVSYSWEPKQRITNVWLCCDNKALITKIITAHSDTFEGGIVFTSGWETPSPAFIDAVEDAVADGIYNVNNSAIKVCRKHSTNLRPLDCPLTDIQNMQLEKALETIKFMGYDINYPIIVCEELGNGCLGMAEDKQIYIAKRCFQIGTKMVATTIFEEYIHLKHNVKDNTYEMQNMLFDIIFTMVEQFGLKEPI